jgi:hypothetical protein
VLDAIATRSAGATNGLNAQSNLTGTSISSPPNWRGQAPPSRQA